MMRLVGNSAQLSMPVATMDYPQSQALVDAAITKSNVRAQEQTQKDTNPNVGKCMNPATGEPVMARGDELVWPVPGTVQVASLGSLGDIKRTGSTSLKGKSGPQRSGDCPLCHAHVPLSASKGAIGAHMMRNEPVGPSVVLSEPRMDVTDSGARIGDPEASHKIRLTEIDGAFGRGKIRIPAPGKNGRIKLEDAPVTEDNVRAALEYWRTRKPRTDTGRQAQNNRVSTLARQLESIMDAQTVRYNDATHTLVVMDDAAPIKRLNAMNAGKSRLSAPKAGPAVGGREHGRSDGAALVKGHPIEPMAGPVTVRHTGDPVPERPTVTTGVDTRKSSTQDTTFESAEGMVRPDPVAVMVPVTPDNRPSLTRTQRRNATRRRKARESAAELARLRAELAAMRVSMRA